MVQIKGFLRAEKVGNDWSNSTTCSAYLTFENTDGSTNLGGLEKTAAVHKKVSTSQKIILSLIQSSCKRKERNKNSCNYSHFLLGFWFSSFNENILSYNGYANSEHKNM